ncbi:MAG: M28 family peptidase [Acidobacteriota bacterium]
MAHHDRMVLNRGQLQHLQPFVFWVVALALTAAAYGAEPAGDLTCGRIGIHGIGHDRLSAVQGAPGLAMWAEIDGYLLACGDGEVLHGLAEDGLVVDALWRGVDPESLFIVRGGHPGDSLEPMPGTELLASGGPFTVLRATEDGARNALDRGEVSRHAIEDGHGHGHGHAGCGRPVVLPLDGRHVLARQSANAPPRGRRTFGPDAAAAVDAIDGDRWFADVETLAGWNRHTHGTEIALAQDWLIAQFEGIGGMTVTTQSFLVGGTTAQNVIAVRPGTSRPEDWILVGAHYDAISENPSIAAPGAEDNASGCAGVLELARVSSTFTPEASLLFLCYSGEEQGLIGSAAHATRLVDDGDAPKVQLMLNMDMIGYTGDADLDCLLETETQFASILDPFVDAAAQFTTLRTVTSLFAFGSDHVPYLNRGMPALLTIENDWDVYPNYHRTGDLPGSLSVDMGTQVLRMNAAVLVQTMGAQPEIFADGFESGSLTAWSSTSP